MDSPNDQKEEIRQQLRQPRSNTTSFPRPGKISVTPTKQLTNQRDLALAYSPGVAAPCEEIVIDPANAYQLHRARQPGRRSSPTAPPCWAWAISARWRPSR